MKNLATSVLFACALLAPRQSFAQNLTATPSDNPAKGGIQPNWAVASDGSILLSWVEPSGEGLGALKYAARRGGRWSEVRTIASGRRFWRHPAEVPELISLGDGTLLAHWVEKGDDSSDAENILVSSSRDGLHWTAPQMAHKDRQPVQHGLASMVASGPQEASLFWLQALKGEDGPVSLMRTVVGADGKEIREEELDKDVCSCCPTSVVKTAKGLVVAYRGHTPQDIRDIAILRFENGHWSNSKILYPDKWQINACPVNAASAAAQGNRVAVAWYTEAEDKPRVQLAFSSDAGATWAKPVVLSTGDTQGYASCVLNADGSAVVSWIEEGPKAASVSLRAVSPNGTTGPILKIAEGSRQSLGYPKLIHSANETWIAWGDKTGVKTAQLK